MTTRPGDGDAESAELTPRDAAYWAKNVSTLRLGEVPPEAINLNVTGKRLVGPIQGFGKLWQKTYRVELTGVDTTPAAVIATWKQAFASFWPKSGRFFGPPSSPAGSPSAPRTPGRTASRRRRCRCCCAPTTPCTSWGCRS